MRTSFILAVAAACLTLVGLAKAQNYEVDWFTIDGGGGTSTGGVFAVSGTIGQPDGGTMSGGGYSLVGGFWGIATTQPPEAPVLSISNSNGAVIVCWPRPADGFLLEQTATLAAPPAAISWSTVPPGSYQTNATRIQLTVPMPVVKQFYRLRKP